MYLDISGTPDPRMWTGSAWISLNPASIGSFDSISPLTTKGDLLGHNGTTNLRLGVGPDTYVLTADSSAPSGISWQPSSGGGGSGTVTSVGLAMPLGIFSVANSPVTTAGVITVSMSNQSANTVMAGPSAGGAIPPSFRALVSADIPNLDFAKITTGNITIARGGTSATTALGAFNNLSPLTTKGDLLSHDGTNNVRVGVGTDGQLLMADSGAAAGVSWQTVSGTGSVTSVALTMPAIFSVAGSPITTSGTFAVTLATQTANTVFAGPSSGGAAAPSFRALVAADIPNLDAAKITTGTLAVSRGGTGLAAPGAIGNVLTSNGTIWVSAPPSGGGSGVEIDLFTYIGGVGPAPSGIDGVRVAEVAKTISKVVCTLRKNGSSGATVVRFFYDATLSSFFDVTIPFNSGLTAQTAVPGVSLGVGEFISAAVISVAGGSVEDLACKVYY